MNIDEQYDNFIAIMEKSGATPPFMAKSDWIIANGLAPKDEEAPITVRPKRNDRPCAPNIDSHIPNIGKKVVREKKPKAVKPPKAEPIAEPKPRYKPQKRYTEEEIKQRRANARKKKRADNKAMGLTVDGKPRRQPKPPKSIEEIRSDRVRYAKTYRTNHREKHLAYRRDSRKKKKKNSPLAVNGSSVSSQEPMSKVA